MLINDRIYGKAKITLPVIVELIKSKPIQRLKGICQFGVPDELYNQKNYNRFEHSIGVMILLKKLGASEEEQIAGLTHDASHTAFSHVIDWVVSDGGAEEEQDRQHEKFIYSSKISPILIKYGYSSKRIANCHNFKLLEDKIPNICADRLDYAFREFPKSIADKCLQSLLIKKGRLVFKGSVPALLFANNYLGKQKNHWGSFEAASRYRLLADVIREAMTDKILSLSDFWQDDKYILRKIKKSKNPKIKKLLGVLRKKSLSSLPKSNLVVYKKFRYVDPIFLSNNKLVRLSKVNNNFKHRLESNRNYNKRGIIIPSII